MPFEAARATLQKTHIAATFPKDSHEIKRKCTPHGSLQIAFGPKNGYNRGVAGRTVFHVRLRCDHRQ
ncbi:hypothetical protein SAMN06265784_102627 [Paraburkholderia susongensis]|uniref:Uncharacterized protein n=1 Tax=Paraburkholderia susongensis TaxID=1515439 RepID=A0A1X7JH93_9BURK|nr:hypothetical protein SAMN06265784_102627 [Paraburkholderia susongensis]